MRRGLGGLLFRVGKAGHAEALKLGANPMMMKGKEMAGFGWVDPAVDAKALTAWIERAERYVGALPKRAARKAATKRRPAS